MNNAAVEDRESAILDKKYNPKPGTTAQLVSHRRQYPATLQKRTDRPRFPGRTRLRVDLTPAAIPSPRGQLRRHLRSQPPRRQSPVDGRKPIVAVDGEGHR